MSGPNSWMPSRATSSPTDSRGAEEPADDQTGKLRARSGPGDAREPAVTDASNDPQERCVLDGVTGPRGDLDGGHDRRQPPQSTSALSLECLTRSPREPDVQNRVGHEVREVEQQRCTRGAPTFIAPRSKDLNAPVRPRELKSNDPRATRRLHPTVQDRERYEQTSGRGKWPDQRRPAHTNDRTRLCCASLLGLAGLDSFDPPRSC